MIFGGFIAAFFTLGIYSTQPVATPYKQAPNAPTMQSVVAGDLTR